MANTPGPWFHTDDERIIEGEGFLIAEITDVSDDDARLIAAAPELLQALKQLYDIFDDHVGFTPEYRAQLDAVIAKAEKGAA